jgi:hypothetical protein
MKSTFKCWLLLDGYVARLEEVATHRTACCGKPYGRTPWKAEMKMEGF